MNNNNDSIHMSEETIVKIENQIQASLFRNGQTSAKAICEKLGYEPSETTLTIVGNIALIKGFMVIWHDSGYTIRYR